ncbi:neutral zinc metallopeptidase [Actinoalloteichus hymeniacidonis]|uniref:Metalloprotease n=1 Tax=Actinoalloteichus hymeniacidonis TaxID=340345 RepID=A0AAC9HN93_9PSEU|nr:neutral zinc metallopeptidase [Actinoalloteichus hymeniacidonis]AOS62321.1 putative metalloprotease [Actinoalloteichus hymeniacidonis]MBB5909651.1 putative metalloprotease [Actinoalloteichus hymeniacidonis]
MAVGFPRRNTSALTTGIALVAVAGLLIGCGPQRVAGTAVPYGGLDPATVSGLPVTNGPSGPKAGAPPIDLVYENGDDGEMDRLALAAVADLYEYWDREYPDTFGGMPFEPVRTLASYHAETSGIIICDLDTTGVPNAFYCPPEDTIAWDRGVLLPGLEQQFGSMAVVTVLAHEMGHAVQYKSGNMTADMPTILAEQQADCYAGAYFRYIANGDSPYFEVSTGEGLNNILAALFSIRDQAGTDFRGAQAHGNAFDRTTAFISGFDEGAARCAEMDVPEMEERITQLEFAPNDQSGQLEINEQHIALVEQSLAEAFAQELDAAPELDLTGASCSETEPASYCVDGNDIGLDLPELAAIGTPPTQTSINADGIGDFAAFAEIASRYTMAVQEQAGLSLEGPTAGLRTACLTGVWAGMLMPNRSTDTSSFGGLRISPGDLDEAVAELLLPDSLIAADINGASVPSGFARVEAFKTGFEENTATCTTQFDGE